MKRLNIVCLALGIFLIGIGLVLAFNPALNFGKSKATGGVMSAPVVSAKVAVPKQETQVDISGQPVRIQISSLGIDLQVVDGYYDSNSQTWTLTKDKVQFAVMTNQPNNQEGLTFMYGHNRAEVFANLHKISAGSEAIVSTANGHTFTYKFLSSYETDPNDSSIFQYKGKPRLVLQTCSGATYQNRQMFVFDLARAQ